MRIAVIIPCYNEERAIGQVVRDFRAALPGAAIHVYDNGSTDRTRELAAEAGARVSSEPLRGKGNVVRRMFADVEADLYVMVDGDATYDAASAPALVRCLVDRGLDMVVGARQDRGGAFRQGHGVGNRLLTGFVAWLFGDRFRDMLSGYRVFSRRFVKSFPAISSGFEIETELAVHALSLRLPVAEMDTPYGARPEGSASKLRTWQDGWRILMTILLLLKEERPMLFFSVLFLALAGLSVGLAVPILLTYMETGLVPRFPTAILSTGLMILAFLALASGVVLDSVMRQRKEIKRLAYLALPPPGAA